MKINKKVFEVLLFYGMIFFSILYLLYTKKIFEYISPKNLWIIFLTMFISFVQILFCLSKIFKRGFFIKEKCPFEICILAFMIFLVPPKIIINENMKQSINVNLKKENFKKEIIKNGIEELYLSDENFFYDTEKIFKNPQKFLNKKITVEGFLFRNSNFNSNEFVVARMLMSCCVADAEPYGILAKFVQIKNYKTNEWIKIKGKIKLEEIQGEMMPIIDVFEIETIKESDQKYIYPNFSVIN